LWQLVTMKSRSPTSLPHLGSLTIDTCRCGSSRRSRLSTTRESVQWHEKCRQPSEGYSVDFAILGVLGAYKFSGHLYKTLRPPPGQAPWGASLHPPKLHPPAALSSLRASTSQRSVRISRESKRAMFNRNTSCARVSPLHKHGLRTDCGQSLQVLASSSLHAHSANRHRSHASPGSPSPRTRLILVTPHTAIGQTP
jgi:hypothetical protein